MNCTTLAPLPLTRAAFWLLVCVFGLLTIVSSTAQLKVFELPIDELRGYTHQSPDGSIWRSGRSGTWRLNSENRTWDSISNSEAILIDPPYIICRDTESNTLRTSFDSGRTFIENRPRVSSWPPHVVVFDDVMYTFEGDQILGSQDSGLTWVVYTESPIQLIGNINALYRRGNYVIAEYAEWIHNRYTTVVYRKQFHSLIHLFEVGNDHVDARPLNINAICLQDGLYEVDATGDSLRQVIKMNWPRITVDASGRYTAVGQHDDKGFICTKVSNNSLWKIDTVDISNIVGAQSVFVDNDTVVILSSRTERVSKNGGKTFTTILRNTGDQWQHVVSTPTGVLLYNNSDAVVDIDSAVQSLRVRSVRPRQFHDMGWIGTSLVAIEENDYLRLDTLWRTTDFRRLFREMIILGQIRTYNGFLFGQYIVRDDTAFEVSTDDGRTWQTITGFPNPQLGQYSHTADVIFMRRQDTLWFCKGDLKVVTTTHPPGSGTYTLHVIDNQTFSIRDGNVYEYRDNDWILRDELDILPGSTSKNTHQALYGVDTDNFPFRWSPTTGVLRLNTTRISSSEVLVSDPYVVYTDSSRRYLVYKEQTTTAIDQPEQRTRTDLPTSILITDNILDISQFAPSSITPPVVTIHAVTGESVLTVRNSWLVRTDSLPRGVYFVTITNRETNTMVDVLIMLN